MMKKSRKSGSISRRKRSRYQDRDENNDTHNGTNDALNETTKPYISPFSIYFRRSRELVPFQGFNSSEVETDNQVVHENSIVSNEAAPIDVTLLHLTQGSDHEDCGSDAPPELVHNVITNIVKSVLSQHRNSTPELELPQDPVRAFGHKCTSVRKATLKMKDDTSMDMPSPITAIIPVAEIAQEYCPHLPLADFSSSACVVNNSDQLQKLDPIHDKISIEKSDEESNQTNCCNAKPDMSLNITEMVDLMDDDDDDEISSLRETTVETVEGYTVRKEFATTLRLILTKHGDIAAGCSFQNVKTRSFFLEQTCEIVEKLEALDLKKVTLPQLEAMRDFVTDLEPSIDVKWLGKRLDDIMETKSIIMQSPLLKEEKMKTKQRIEEMRKGIEEEKKVISALQEKLKRNEENLAALEDQSGIITEKCLQATVKVKRFHNKPLVRDLL